MWIVTRRRDHSADDGKMVPTLHDLEMAACEESNEGYSGGPRILSKIAATNRIRKSLMEHTVLNLAYTGTIEGLWFIVYRTTNLWPWEIWHADGHGRRAMNDPKNMIRSETVRLDDFDHACHRLFKALAEVARIRSVGGYVRVPPGAITDVREIAPMLRAQDSPKKIKLPVGKPNDK